MQISGALACASKTVLLLALLISLDGFDQDNKSDQAALEFNGIAEVQNVGLYSRAASKWEMFIKTFPNYDRIDEAHYYLGICQLQLKKFSDAAASFRTVLAKYPKSNRLEGAQYNLGMASFQIARAAKNADQLKAAAAEFAQVFARHAKGKYVDRALYFQAEALYAAGDLNGAAAAYKKLASGYPKSPLLPDALYALGTTEQELSLHADAASTFQSFLDNKSFEAHSLRAEIRLRLGMSLYEQQKFDDAAKVFAAVSALKEFPNADFALLRHAQCHIEKQKHAEAIALLNTMLSKHPQSAYRVVALLAKGKSHFAMEDYKAGRTPLEEALKSDTNESPEAAYWFAQSLLKLSKPAESLKVVEQLGEKYAQSVFAPHLKLVRIEALYEMPDRRKETPALYAEFAQQHGDHELAPWALYKTSLASLQQGDYSLARQHADAFLANPKMAQHKLVASVLFCTAESHVLGYAKGDQSADLNHARKSYERLVSQYPQNLNASQGRVRIGWCHYQSQEHDAAIKFLNSSLDKLDTLAHKAEALLLVGRCHAAARRDKDAVVAYETALKVLPDWDRADELLLATAESLRKSNDLDGALQRLNRLHASFQNSSLRDQALMQLGEIAQEKKEYDQAIVRYRELVDKHANSELAPFAQYGLGVAYFAKQDDNNSLTVLTNLLAKHADSEVAARAHYVRGLCNQRLERFDAAVKDLQRFVASEPPQEEAIKARFQAAVCQVGLEKLDPAVASFKMLLDEFPDCAESDQIHYELAHALLELKRIDESVVIFRALATKFADSSHAAESWFHVGRFHEKKASGTGLRPDQTAVEIQKAMKAFADGLGKAQDASLREKLQYKIGYLLFTQTEYEKAAVTLQKQIHDHPQGSLAGTAKFFCAESLYRLEDYQKALPLFEQVATTKVPEHHAEALYRAGASAGNLQDWQRSQKHYSGLIATFPKFDQIDEARYGLGWAFQNLNQLAQARDMYEQIKVSKSTTAAKAKFMLGEISFSEKKYEDAIVIFLYVAVNYPFAEWQALARFEAGRCFVELGSKEQAIDQLEIVVKEYPNHPKAGAASVLIAELKK